jgi:hypothetical protein
MPDGADRVLTQAAHVSRCPRKKIDNLASTVENLSGSTAGIMGEVKDSVVFDPIKRLLRQRNCFVSAASKRDSVSLCPW